MVLRYGDVVWVIPQLPRDGGDVWGGCFGVVDGIGGGEVVSVLMPAPALHGEPFAVAAYVAPRTALRKVGHMLTADERTAVELVRERVSSLPALTLMLLRVVDRLAPHVAADVVTPAELKALGAAWNPPPQKPEDRRRPGGPDEQCRCEPGDTCPRPIPAAMLPNAPRCTREELAAAGFELMPDGKPLAFRDSRDDDDDDDDGEPTTITLPDGRRVIVPAEGPAYWDTGARAALTDADRNELAALGHIIVENFPNPDGDGGHTMFTFDPRPPGGR
jgi:hypothetical protein